MERYRCHRPQHADIVVRLRSAQSQKRRTAQPPRASLPAPPNYAVSAITGAQFAHPPGPHDVVLGIDYD